MKRQASRRTLLTAEVLSVGSELMAGETRDTNAGELARSLTELGLSVGRLTALPDRLADVRAAIVDALGRSDVIVTTGGLGPTPDDLTREAIAEALGEQPSVDPTLERWLRRLFSRRGLPFPEANLKQAWLIPSARPIPNPHGTAPGWFVESRGAVLAALPGPPREMRPLWREWVVPRLRERGAGRNEVRRTYRLAGIGESLVADMLGGALLRSANPSVATYARAEAVDVRIAARDEPGRDGQPPRAAADVFREAEAVVLASVGTFVWGHDDETWAAAIGAELGAKEWRVALVEVGTGGALTTLLGEVPSLTYAEVLALDATVGGRPIAGADLASLARLAAETSGVEVGVALRAIPTADDTTVETTVTTPVTTRTDRRTAFLRGSHGRSRAALAAAAVLLETLRSPESAEEDRRPSSADPEPVAVADSASPSAPSVDGTGQ